MRHGFLKAAAASPALRVADCAYNTEQIMEQMRTADEAGVRLLVFPELCITGYTCADLFYQPTLLDGALKGLKKIADASERLSCSSISKSRSPLSRGTMMLPEQSVAR